MAGSPKRKAETTAILKTLGIAPQNLWSLWKTRSSALTVKSMMNGSSDLSHSLVLHELGVDDGVVRDTATAWPSSFPDQLGIASTCLSFVLEDVGKEHEGRMECTCQKTNPKSWEVLIMQKVC